MIQQRQFRRSHPDAHYAAAVFRYMRKYALLFSEHCLFLSIDDKHRVKVGERAFPVAAAERGRCVLVGAQEEFQVGDHDFTKFSLVPSVTLLCDLPSESCGSWYEGQVFVLLKDAIFQPSSPTRHACELHQIIHSSSRDNLPILFLYSDGGPDNRLTYISVQISLICLFLKLDLDFLCAGRTTPYHSWRNPVERIMSILNLGLQCVGLAREKLPDELEAEVAKCNSMSDIRKVAEKKPVVIAAAFLLLKPC